MPAGRPRKPDSIRQRTHQLPALTILPGQAKPPIAKPPVGLLASSRRIWRSLFASPVARAIDLEADVYKLHRWIEMVDEHQRVSQVFRAKRIVTGSMGQPVLNPLGSYLATLESQISKMETEFGIGPLSRMRLGIATGQAALTADELNRRLDQSGESGQEQQPEPEEWEREWQQA